MPPDTYTQDAGEDAFYLEDGAVLSTLKDLYDHLRRMSDETFRHHVSDERNDFATWATDVFGTFGLAESMRNTRSRQGMRNVISLWADASKVTVKRQAAPVRAPKTAPQKIEVLPLVKAKRATKKRTKKAKKTATTIPQASPKPKAPAKTTTTARPAAPSTTKVAQPAAAPAPKKTTRPRKRATRRSSSKADTCCSMGGRNGQHDPICRRHPLMHGITDFLLGFVLGALLVWLFMNTLA